MSSRRSRLLRLLGVLALAVLVLTTYHSFLRLELLGSDTFAMILTSRVSEVDDLLGNLTEELMDGRYPDGHYYRPLVNLSFGLDYALWGLDPLGYHLSDLAALLANAILLTFLARRLFGPGFELAGAWAAIVFTLHPIHLEVLSVPARRGDALCLVFMLSCLVCYSVPSASRTRRLLTGLLALAAVSAKETGIVLAPLAFGIAWLRHPNEAMGRRWRQGIGESFPVLIALLLFSLARTLVLGGLGGYSGESLQSDPTHLLGLIGSVTRWVLEPQPVFSDAGLTTVFPMIASLFLCAVTLLALWRPPMSRAASSRCTQSVKLLALWTLCLVAVSSLSGRLYDWYALSFLAPYSLLLGFLVQRGVRAVQHGNLLSGATMLFGPLVLLAVHLAFSPMLRPYPELKEASEHAGDLLGRLKQGIERSEPGERVVIDRFKIFHGKNPDEVGVHQLWIFTDYSLQAYAEMVVPEKPVRVRESRRPSQGIPAPDVIDVVLFPGRLSSKRPGAVPGPEHPGREKGRAEPGAHPSTPRRHAQPARSQ